MRNPVYEPEDEMYMANDLFRPATNQHDMEVQSPQLDYLETPYEEQRMAYVSHNAVHEGAPQAGADLVSASAAQPVIAESQPMVIPQQTDFQEMNYDPIDEAFFNQAMNQALEDLGADPFASQEPTMLDNGINEMVEMDLEELAGGDPFLMGDT